MKLSLEHFKRVVRDTVLVSLDLLVINEKNEILVGRRRNSPARGYLFVPGGRVRKNESLAEALRRISHSEIGVELAKEHAILYGIYDHVYPDDSFVEPDVTSHYVVIACLFHVHSSVSFRNDGQHDELQIMSIRQLLAHPDVHAFTRNYFLQDPENVFLMARVALPSGADLLDNYDL